jgi:peroxiredoxin family protein
MNENGNNKMVVVCNHADAPHVMPTLIMGASGVSIGEEVMLFFCPGGACPIRSGFLTTSSTRAAGSSSANWPWRIKASM